MPRLSQKVEISYKTILFAFGVFYAIQLVEFLAPILMQVFVALILMAVLNPAVSRIEKRKWFDGKLQFSRISAILLTYCVGILLLTTFLLLITPPLTEQSVRLATQLPMLFDVLDTWGVNEAVLQAQLSQIGSLSVSMFGNVFQLAGSVFANVFALVTTLVLSFYLLLERDRLSHHLTMLFDNDSWEKKVSQFIDRLEYQMGGWIRGQLMLMLIVGVLSYAGFWILGIPYALPLALIAGVLEIVPNIGPLVAAVPAVIAGYLISPWIGLGALIWSMVVQVLENNLIVPQVMARNTGLNPLVTLPGLIVGFFIAGVMGALLVLPVLIIVRTIYQEFFSEYTLAGRTGKKESGGGG